MGNFGKFWESPRIAIRGLGLTRNRSFHGAPLYLLHTRACASSAHGAQPLRAKLRICPKSLAKNSRLARHFCLIALARRVHWARNPSLARIAAEWVGHY